MVLFSFTLSLKRLNATWHSPTQPSWEAFCASLTQSARSCRATCVNPHLERLQNMCKKCKKSANNTQKDQKWIKRHERNQKTQTKGHSWTSSSYSILLLNFSISLFQSATGIFNQDEPSPFPIPIASSVLSRWDAEGLTCWLPCHCGPTQQTRRARWGQTQRSR